MSEKFTFFWKGPFSQWYLKAPFIVYGSLYNCAEQFMMASKARFFKDYNTLELIMDEKDPKEQKALGRRVKNFVESEWNAVARAIVYRGNIAKFAQNPVIGEKLVATVGTTLVEASPVDHIWGIKLAEDHPDAQDRKKWRGTNWLGETLTKVRDDIMSGLIGECRYCTYANRCAHLKNLQLISKDRLLEVKDCLSFSDEIVALDNLFTTK